MNFRYYFEQATGGGYLTSDFTGSEQTPKMTGNPLHLPSIDFVVPKIQRSGVIKQLELKTNPIKMLLSDGTRLFFTYDEFKRIKGAKPEIGKTITVVMQRRLEDKTSNTSQIENIFCN